MLYKKGYGKIILELVYYFYYYYYLVLGSSTEL